MFLVKIRYRFSHFDVSDSANARNTDRKDLLSELELMKRLKPHPHVIKLLGCVTETGGLMLYFFLVLGRYSGSLVLIQQQQQKLYFHYWWKRYKITKSEKKIVVGHPK